MVPIVLKNLGVDLEKARVAVLQVLEKATGSLGYTKFEKPGFFGQMSAKENPSARAPLREAAMNNFTPRAQQVLALARKEADRFNHNFVGTEHVLLGLIALNEGVAVNALENQGLDLETVRMEIEKQVGTGPEQKIIGNIPYTPRVKKVLALAAEEAKNLNHMYVGTEHILLGLMREGDGVAARVLKNLKVDIEKTRQKILGELDPNFAGAKESPVASASTKSGASIPLAVEERVVSDVPPQEPEPTPRAKEALRFARLEAERLKHNTIAPEHILIGLVALGQGIAFDTLQKLGLDLTVVRGEVEKQVIAGSEHKIYSNLDYDSRSKAALAFSIEEAKALKQSFIGTEHILLGLLRQEDWLVSQVLKNLGADPSKIRAEVLKEIERIFGK